MTKDMMAVRSLVEKSADADLMREIIGFAAIRDAPDALGQGQSDLRMIVWHVRTPDPRLSL